MEVKFQGMWDTVKRVARGAFPQGQQGNADLIDVVAQQKLGMPVPEALGLLSGEFASIQTSPSMDFAKQVYFFGIRKKPEALKLMRTVFSDQITAERNEGDVTFLKISLGGKRGSAGVAQFQARRGQFPENLSGLSYFDFQKVDWPAVKDRWIAEAKKSSVAKTVNSSNDGVPSAAPDWLAQMDLQVVARHLHYSSSVSW